MFLAKDVFWKEFTIEMVTHTTLFYTFLLFFMQIPVDNFSHLSQFIFYI